MNRAAIFALALLASPAIGETLNCSTWQGIATCLGNDGYVSHEIPRGDTVYGSDNWGNKWSETKDERGRKTLTIEPGTRQK